MSHFQMLLPMSVTDYSWVYHGISSVKSNNVGKWMLFYPTSQIDKKWLEICSLYDQNKLPGIVDMKCSTSKPNPRSTNDKEQVIILYCNNSNNEEEIIKIGKSLLPYIRDYSKNTIYYKTDTQTAMGTGATGVKKNSTYKLSVEKPVRCLLE